MKKFFLISVVVFILIVGWILKDLKVVYNIKDTYYVITYFTIAKAIVLVIIFGIVCRYIYIKIVKNRLR